MAEYDNDDTVATDDKKEKKDISRESDDELMFKARERYKRAKEYWGPKYELAKADKRFYAGNSENNYQWPDAVISQMSANAANRPRLTINRLPQFHNQIVNDYRQATIGVKASPQGDEDKEVAKVYAGLFKQIEKQSYAQVAYVTALSDASIGGLSWLRVVSDYARPDSFDQDLFIKRVVNPAKVIPDETATGFFLEDAGFLFFEDTMSYDDFEEEYPDADDPENFVADDYSAAWRDNSKRELTICEYFYFKTRKRKLVQFADGSSAWADETRTETETHGNVDQHIVKRRMADCKELHWCKMDGYQVLERRMWPKPRIPFIPIWGNELWIEDDRTFEGQVRGVKDSQRMYNYMQSTKTEMIALSPKAPYIAAEGQLEGRDQEWRDAATTPKSVLYYKPVSVDGVIVPPPQRQSYEAPVQAVIQASLQSSDDMKAVLGVYDASLGARGNEVSGRAINARKQEGDTATYNFVDNLSMGVGYMATVIAELIPVYYDSKRTIRIITPDNKQITQRINGEGEPRIFDAQYDLVLDTGPSFSTQRQESVAIITELSQNFPKLLEVAGDVAIRNMDFKGSDEIADRLKRTLPPQVVGEDADPETKLAAAQTQLDAAKQAIQALTGQVEEDKVKLQTQALELKNKAGELRIKQQEISLKRMELNQRQNEGDANNDTNGEETAVISAINELHAQIAELQSMVEAAVEGDQSAPIAPDGATTPSADENNSAAPASEATPPVSDPAQPTEG